MGYEHMLPTGFIFTKYEVGLEKTGIIGVIGPARMNFQVVLPYVKYVRDLLTEAMMRI